jgi:UTP--glucose-1-phosphate uridylyltransferase
MLSVYERTGCSVVALKEVPPSEISSYGCATHEPIDDNLVRILDVVEKPAADEAPSNLAVIGRYVFTREIFDALELIEPGKGGEIQLTDAIKELLADRTVYGWTFRHGRFDVGNKLDFLRATIELALEREDLGPGLRAYLRELGRTGMLG